MKAPLEEYGIDCKKYKRNEQKSKNPQGFDFDITLNKLQTTYRSSYLCGPGVGKPRYYKVI